MRNFRYHFRLEMLALRSRLGGWGRITGIHLPLIALFGVFLPWRRGIEFLDPVLMTAYGCLGILFAAPAAAQAFAAEWRERSMAEAMARIAVAVLYGECVAALFVSAGLATVYLTHRQSALFGVDWTTLATAMVLGLMAAFALAATAGWISLQFSAGVARGALRTIFLLLLFLFFFRSQWLPDVAARGTLVCLGWAALATWALRRGLERTV